MLTLKERGQPGWRKPPPGVPRMCWNIYEQRYKVRYDSEEEALERVTLRAPEQIYRCSHCSRYHVGRPSTHPPSFEIGRRDDLIAELGIRAASHLLSGDTQSSINKRFRTVDRILGFGRRR